MLNKDFPRAIGKDRKYPVGLYIELKDYTNNLNYLGIDMVEEMNALLAHYGISTVADSTNKMPIIVQSFEVEALDKYATLSDLPLIKLHGYVNTTNEEWESFGQKYHGVGPNADWVMNPTSLSIGPTTWIKKTANNTYSKFIEKMHSLNLAVHPYTLKNDNLQYRKNAFLETQLYVDNGIDGVFTEYPQTTYEILTGLGSKAAWPPVTPAAFGQQ